MICQDSHQNHYCPLIIRIIAQLLTFKGLGHVGYGLENSNDSKNMMEGLSDIAILSLGNKAGRHVTPEKTIKPEQQAVFDHCHPGCHPKNQNL